jgi:hypothetical protein
LSGMQGEVKLLCGWLSGTQGKVSLHPIHTEVSLHPAYQTVIHTE